MKIIDFAYRVSQIDGNWTYLRVCVFVRIVILFIKKIYLLIIKKKETPPQIYTKKIIAHKKFKPRLRRYDFDSK